MSYVVITEETNGPSGGTIVEYANREAAEEAIRQRLGAMASHGATITGDMQHGYTAVWREGGYETSLRITLGQVQ